VIDLVDCDVHPPNPTAADLAPHLPAVWRDFVARARFTGSKGAATAYPPGAPTSRAEGRTLADVIDGPGRRLAVLNCYYGVETIRHPDLAPALAAAVNDWLRTSWLARDARLRASVVVPSEQPEAAAAEVERAVGLGGFVQVLLPARSGRPYGSRAYDPLLAAAAGNGLPVAIHFGGMTGAPPTSVGWPSSYFEEYVGMAAVFQSQLTSLVVEGAFERFPGLRVVLAEGGWTWLPSLLWRLDKDWKGLRRETPWLRRRPSEYVRENVQVTLQPLDCPPDDVGPALEALEQIGGPERLLYASDHPHRHAVAPERLLDALDAAERARVLAGNAAELYRLD
jgi:predicted TIM-barrel fold metal-dependent hydrolase